MQDKDFDQLFRDRFEEAEIEAPARLWDSIAEELVPKKKKVGLPFYWMSAAALGAVVLGVSFFNQKTERIKLQAPVAVRTEIPVEATDPNTIQTKNITGNGQVKVATSTPLVIAPRLNSTEIKNNQEPLQPQEPIGHPVDRETLVSASVSEPVKTAEVKEEVMMARVELPAENTGVPVTDTPQTEHRGIRNVGDLVNFVVSKVDRRENKIVQFDTDEDDNSSLVSLNLGIIKIGKKSSK